MNKRRFLAAAAATALAPAATAGSSHLTRDQRVLTWGGSPVRLRGVAVGDPLSLRHDQPISDYRRISADWNANTVRVSIESAGWAGQRARALSLMRREVAAARQANLFVILDWHTIGWPDGFAEDGYDTSSALARDFWSTAADLYGRDGAVAFELWNEPVSTDAYGSAGARWPELRAWYHHLIDRIRRRAPESLVLCAGNRYASDLRGVKANPVDRPNVAYSWHIYPGHYPSRLGLLGDLDSVAPVLVTEWGYAPFGVPSYMVGTKGGYADPFWGFMSRRSMGSTAWVWAPWWAPAMWRSPSAATDWRWDRRTEFGDDVRAKLRALRTQRRPDARSA